METTRHCHLVVSDDYVAFHALCVGLFTTIIRLSLPLRVASGDQSEASRDFEVTAVATNRSTTFW